MSANWYWMDQGTRQGPITSKELRDLSLAGRIHPDTQVQKDGMAGWVPASQVKGLFDASNSTDSQRNAHPSATDGSTASAAYRMARERAALLLSDLKTLNWREEVIPIDASNLRELSRDYVFWCVALLGTVPLLIWTISRPDYQLTAFALFFAALWGVAFKYFVVRVNVGWKLLIASLFFTGVIGIPGLLFVYQFLPDAYLKMPDSKLALVQLAGMILQVGVCEELLKAVPTVAYLAWRRTSADPMTALLVGVFSGLGFAAFENIHFGDLSVVTSYNMAQQFGAAGHIIGVQDAMATALARSLSAVFCHAVWSGITAYFLLMAFLTIRRAPILAPTGILLAATLHGSYNWLAGIQLTLATLVVAGSFVLFYAYVTKLRTLVASATEPQDASDASNEFDQPSTAEPSLAPGRA